MDAMRKMNCRFTQETLVKLDEILAAQNAGNPVWRRKSRGQLIREMVDEILSKTWKPPLFADTPQRPADEPARKRPQRRSVNHTKTPAARKYLKHMKRKRYARA